MYHATSCIATSVNRQMLFFLILENEYIHYYFLMVVVVVVLVLVHDCLLGQMGNAHETRAFFFICWPTLQLIQKFKNKSLSRQEVLARANLPTFHN
jgi:hypothetical protein